MDQNTASEQLLLVPMSPPKLTVTQAMLPSPCPFMLPVFQIWLAEGLKEKVSSETRASKI